MEISAIVTPGSVDVARVSVIKRTESLVKVLIETDTPFPVIVGMGRNIVFLSVEDVDGERDVTKAPASVAIHGIPFENWEVWSDSDRQSVVLVFTEWDYRDTGGRRDTVLYDAD